MVDYQVVLCELLTNFFPKNVGTIFLTKHYGITINANIVDISHFVGSEGDAACNRT